MKHIQATVVERIRKHRYFMLILKLKRILLAIARVNWQRRILNKQSKRKNDNNNNNHKIPYILISKLQFLHVPGKKKERKKENSCSIRNYFPFQLWYKIGSYVEFGSNSQIFNMKFWHHLSNFRKFYHICYQTENHSIKLFTNSEDLKFEILNGNFTYNIAKQIAIRIYISSIWLIKTLFGWKEQ